PERRLRAFLAARNRTLGQDFEKDPVAAAALVQAEKQHDRYLQNQRQAERSLGKLRRCAQERTARGLGAAERPVAQHAADFPGFQAFLDLQHRFGTAGDYRALLQLGRQIVQHFAARLGGVRVHHDIDGVAAVAAQRAQRFKAAQVRAQQYAAPAPRQYRIEL